MLITNKKRFYCEIYLWIYLLMCYFLFRLILIVPDGADSLISILEKYMQGHSLYALLSDRLTYYMTIKMTHFWWNLVYSLRLMCCKLQLTELCYKYIIRHWLLICSQYTPIFPYTTGFIFEYALMSVFIKLNYVNLSVYTT